MTTFTPLPHPPGTGRPTGSDAAQARPAVEAFNLTKSYGRADTSVTALNEVSVRFDAGKFTAIMGPSGSGKSTLMHCLAGLDTADSGRIVLGGTELTGPDADTSLPIVGSSDVLET